MAATIFTVTKDAKNKQLLLLG